jgi:MPBQ/MSBQ methyltransferase
MKLLLSIFALTGANVAAFTPNASPTNIAPKHAASSSTQLSMGLGGTIVKAAKSSPTATAIAGGALLGTVAVKAILDRPSRTYEDGSVAREYDAWTQDGILEYYWGEHIHLGYYNEEE